ncbi:putative serine/threonine-protein kinase abkC [Heracleum sosnowskyi]|uniref:Serine/threonine-protein kinase abkC n=1 Tax=Heracleum sosnowskyi TaxID=360622 RepID=A0AAD8IVR9_9APIA|nr:putative serine/threonine-protein kinase abkC [Heracleum sosnowskyi]
MSRLLAFSNFRRAAYSLLQSSKASSSQLYNCGAPCAYGIPYSLSRLYSQYRVSNRRLTRCILYDVKATLQKTGGRRNLYFLASNRISSHAQIAWKRLSHICSYSGPIFPPISRIACAVSLALTRSHLVAPGVLALIFRELTCSERIWAEAEGFPSKDSLYMHAQDGHVYLTSFVFSLFEGLIMFLRAIYLTVIFSPCIAMAPFADSFGIEFRKKWLRLVHLTLEKAGPAFIKWGQWAATRPDLFPSDMCTELAELQTNAPAHGYDYTKRTIERAFGRKIPEIFEKFEEKPIASGSIAQVHRATLKFRYPGQRSRPILVAVKVRHPGVGEAIRRDFMLINFFVKFSKAVPTLKWLRLDESMQQFAVFMMSQVDLAREAANLSRFTYNFRRWKDVSFPKPLYPLVHPAVLVETYEHGNNILHYVDDVDVQEPIKSGLAHIGTHVLLKMLLVDNFIHADMHPGNILVRVNHKKAPSKGLFKSRPHVIFLDVGMTAELSKTDRVNLLEFFKAVALRDGRTAAERTLRLSKQQNCPNPAAFIKEVESSFQLWGSTEGDLIHPADCMHELLDQVRRHKVNIDGNVTTVMVTTLVLEGWQRKLDPEYDVMHTLQTMLFKVDWAESLFYTIEGLMAP